MTTDKIITISRQQGSGGREIGRRLAHDLNIPFYDRELLALAAEKSGFSQAAFEEVDEVPTNSFLYNLSLNSHMAGGGGFVMGYNDALLTPDKLFLIQSDIIRQIAKEGPCVIVGRCADYILEEDPRLVSVFVYANEDFRMERLVEFKNIPRNKAKAQMAKIDKKRSNYYNYNTGKRWSEANSYHLCLDSSKLGIDKAVQAIEAYLQVLESK